MDTKMNALDTLYSEVQGHRSAMPLSELLDFVRKFPALAPFNAASVAHQRRNAIFVATEKDWFDRFGRVLIPGVEPVIIPHPCAPVRFVYDFADTEGPTVPDDVINPFKTVGPATDDGYRLVVDTLRRQGLSARDEADNHAPSTKLTSVFRELGHVFAGHDGEDPDREIRSRVAELDEEQREFEADAIAWVLAGRVGLRTPPGRLLNNYLKHDGLMPQVSRDAILQSVNEIEKLFGGPLELGTIIREDAPSLF